MSADSRGNLLRSRYGLILLAFLAIVAFFLVTEHAAHIYGVLPYVLLILLPILHLLMHRGHSTEHSGNTHSQNAHPEDGKR